MPEFSHTCIIVVTLLLCICPASSETVVRREHPHHGGTSALSGELYEHEVLHEGTVHRIRDALKHSKTPVELSQKMVTEDLSNVQATARHEVESLVQEELAPELEKSLTKSGLQAKDKYYPDLNKVEVHDFQTIKSGDLVTLRDKLGIGYITASEDCADLHQPPCASGEHKGCVRLSNATADHLEINQVGGTHGDNAIQFTGEVSLLSKMFTSNLTHGYYLGICKTNHMHPSNGQLYWFHEEKKKLVLSNTLFTISWEEPAEHGLELTSKMEVALLSPTANGYLMSDDKGAEEKYFDVGLRKDLADKARWIIDLQSA